MAEKSTSLKTVPASKAALSRVELRSAGRALRDKVSRRSHADWPVSSDRQDPIELLIESNKGRIPQLIPIRYGRMKQSPFAFFRGARIDHRRPIWPARQLPAFTCKPVEIVIS